MDSNPPPTSPCNLESASGLAVQVNPNGSIRRMSCGGTLLNPFPCNEGEGGPANIYLRRHGDEVAATALLGPQGHSAVQCESRSMTFSGEWRGIRFLASLVLAESASAWFWHLAFENCSDKANTLDLFYAQDLALADYAEVRQNEYYVSHYIDH